MLLSDLPTWRPLVWLAAATMNCTRKAKVQADTSSDAAAARTAEGQRCFTTVWSCQADVGYLTHFLAGSLLWCCAVLQCAGGLHAAAGAAAGYAAGAVLPGHAEQLSHVVIFDGVCCPRLRGV